MFSWCRTRIRPICRRTTSLLQDLQLEPNAKCPISVTQVGNRPWPARIGRVYQVATLLRAISCKVVFSVQRPASLAPSSSVVSGVGDAPNLGPRWRMTCCFQYFMLRFVAHTTFKMYTALGTRSGLIAFGPSHIRTHSRS